MQLKYNRQSSLGSSIFKNLIRLLFAVIIFIFAIFLIEKVDFPSPKIKYEIDITNEIEKL
jgi:flagellar biogenesis protein FliO|tara:strand:+ start:2156 stop:2335 length:180 start_codon:yes stop_codon:yes gene_type:complete